MLTLKRQVVATPVLLCGVLLYSHAVFTMSSERFSTKAFNFAQLLNE